jgi:hypothetical protein
VEFLQHVHGEQLAWGRCAVHLLDGGPLVDVNGARVSRSGHRGLVFVVDLGHGCRGWAAEGAEREEGWESMEVGMAAAEGRIRVGGSA